MICISSVYPTKLKLFNFVFSSGRKLIFSSNIKVAPINVEEEIKQKSMETDGRKEVIYSKRRKKAIR